MENLELMELSLSEMFDKMQIIREKIHLDYATHDEIETLNELEYLIQDSAGEFQPELWS